MNLRLKNPLRLSLNVDVIYLHKLTRTPTPAFKFAASANFAIPAVPINH